MEMVFLIHSTNKRLIIGLCSILIMISLCACGESITDTVERAVSGNIQTSKDVVNDYFDKEKDNVDLKFNSFSAKDIVEGNKEASEDVYYDRKSGEYVSITQYKANNFVDSVKEVWPYVTIICFMFGFLIRRLVKSSATLRRFGLLLEIFIPLLFALFVYVISYAADSSLVDLFDNIF